MEIAELRRQKIIASAALDKVKQLYSRGAATAEELAHQQDILDRLRNYTIATPPPQILPTAPLKGELLTKHEETYQPKLAEIPLQFTEEQKAVLNALKSELDAIDLEKNRLINALVRIPKKQNALAEVQAIKAMRERWMQKGDEIYYFQKHGTMPDAPAEKDKLTEYEKELPRDKYELDKLRRNLLPNLSKYKNALRAAKTEAKKSHYNTMIMQANMKLVAIENLMSVNLTPKPEDDTN